ncbi:MAG TPA: hypothetical protein VFJ14_06760 [Nocardioidaceae bacterium]|nr:hypothetical protein [Nocardioidaceae bacterium]
MSDGQTLNVGAVPPTPREDTEAARRAIARLAADSDDAAWLLEALGLGEM